MSPIVQPTPETIDTLINFPPPTWLSHTPIYMLPYERFDGPDPADTDAKYLSVGLAQWRHAPDQEQHAVSIKAWRKPYKRWSRESEEIPIHRLVDMTILLAHALLHDDASADVELAAGTFEHQATTITLRPMAEVPSGSARFLEHCRGRLRALRDTLNQLDPADDTGRHAARRTDASAPSPAERADAWRLAATGLPDTPPLSDEAISRESMYDTRG